MSDKERLSKVAEFHRLRELRAEMEVDEETIGIERVRAIHNANQVCSHDNTYQFDNSALAEFSFVDVQLQVLCFVADDVQHQPAVGG